jgi:proline iminopeptidase
VSLPSIELSEVLELPDGRTVEWEARGDGDPLLWIEGGPGFPAHLARPDVDLIADRFRCYLVNAPGCGRTSPPMDPSGYSLEGHVEFFDAVRAGLSLDRVTLMGHSWGGLVAIAFAALRPGNVGRLVVIDGYAGEGSVSELSATSERERAFDRVRDRPWFETALQAFDDATADSPSMTEEELVRTFIRCLPLYFADPESETAIAHIERLRREFRWNIDVSERWDAGELDDVVPLLPRVSCPTLVMVGELDFICGPVWNRPIAEGIPGARYVEFEGVGHLPQYEDAERFRRELLDWLGES